MSIILGLATVFVNYSIVFPSDSAFMNKLKLRIQPAGNWKNVLIVRLNLLFLGVGLAGLTLTFLVGNVYILYESWESVLAYTLSTLTPLTVIHRQIT